jgi:hypothetical protein
VEKLKNNFVYQNSKGSLNLPMVFIFLILFTTSFGILSLQFYWNQQVSTQLRLDQCIAKTSQQLLNSLQMIDQTNQTMIHLRELLIPGSLLPQTKASLQIALQAAHAINLTQVHLWKLKQVTWLTQHGCDFKNDIPIPLPPLPWVPDPPDALGPRPLRSILSLNALKTLHIEIQHYDFSIQANKKSSLASAAKLYQESTWKRSWTQPHSRFSVRTSTF